MEGGRIMQEWILATIIKIEDEHILEVIYAFITELISDEWRCSGNESYRLSFLHKKSPEQYNARGFLFLLPVFTLLIELVDKLFKSGF